MMGETLVDTMKLQRGAPPHEPQLPYICARIAHAQTLHRGTGVSLHHAAAPGVIQMSSANNFIKGKESRTDSHPPPTQAADVFSDVGGTLSCPAVRNLCCGDTDVTSGLTPAF